MAGGGSGAPGASGMGGNSGYSRGGVSDTGYGGDLGGTGYAGQRSGGAGGAGLAGYGGGGISGVAGSGWGGPGGSAGRQSAYGGPGGGGGSNYNTVDSKGYVRNAQGGLVFGASPLTVGPRKSLTTGAEFTQRPAYGYSNVDPTRPSLDPGITRPAPNPNIDRNMQSSPGIAGHPGPGVRGASTAGGRGK